MLYMIEVSSSRVSVHLSNYRQPKSLHTFSVNAGLDVLTLSYDAPRFEHVLVAFRPYSR